MVESTGLLPFQHLNDHWQVREMSADVRSASFFEEASLLTHFTRN
jgi:hypothetical protein